MEKFIAGGMMETHPNENCRTFHMRHELVPNSKWFASDISITTWEEVQPLPGTRSTFEALLGVPGVKEVTVNQYEFRIVKAKAFTWNMLMPKIRLEMSRYLPASYV